MPNSEETIQLSRSESRGAPRLGGMGLSPIRRLWQYARGQRGALLLGVAAALVNAAGAAAYAYLLGPVLKALLSGTPFAGTPLLTPQRLPWALVGVALLKGLSGLLYSACMVSAGQRTLEALRTDLYRHLLAQPPRFYAAHHTGDLFSRLMNDVSQVEFAVSQAFASYVKDSLQIVALLAVCAALDWRLFVLAFVLLPLAALPVQAFARRVRGIARHTQSALARLTALVSEQLHGLWIVQAFRAEPAARARYATLEAEYLGGMKRSLFARGAFTPVLELLGIGGLALALGFGAQQIAHEPALGTKVLSFFSAALLLYPPLRSLSGTWAATLLGAAAAQRLFELRDAPLPPRRTAHAAPLRQGLAFRKVAVRYPDGREGLRGVSFTMTAGQHVALVGPSGGGKSTLLSTLLGFWEPSAGEIYWDGASLGGLDVASVRAQIGWVPQEPTLFTGSVRDNLLMARPEANEAALWEALRLAHAEQWIRSLASGLDHPVGERGAQLSGGERQRIAIARAFLRAPSLLLLDEPTHALDALTEREVQAALASLLKDRTVLVVAHRLATVEQADWILVLEEGRIVQEGKHAELAGKPGKYAQLLAAGTLSAAEG